MTHYHDRHHDRQHDRHHSHHLGGHSPNALHVNICGLCQTTSPPYTSTQRGVCNNLRQNKTSNRPRLLTLAISFYLLNDFSNTSQSLPLPPGRLRPRTEGKKTKDPQHAELCDRPLRKSYRFFSYRNTKAVEVVGLALPVIARVSLVCLIF